LSCQGKHATFRARMLCVLFESRVRDIRTSGEIREVWKPGYKEGTWAPSNG
jgi:hypothetical protein